MTAEQIAIVFAGALAGGFVNGLSGFGSALVAIGIWLHALPAPTAATLAIISSVASQLQTLPLIWGRIDWPVAAPYVLPGLLGAPLGVAALSILDPSALKTVIGAFLLIYAVTALARPARGSEAAPQSPVDMAVGFGSGILGGLTGLSGALMAMWTDVRGGGKDHRRTLLQVFNLTILATAFAGHGLTGRLDAGVGKAVLAGLPGTIVGAWLGARVYKLLGDKDYRRILLFLLMLSGSSLLLSGR